VRAALGVISTIEAKCKDCYKCVRACPVKAIRIRAGVAEAGARPMYAEVVEERCILDGECLRVCPQKAKRVRPEAGRVRRWLEQGEAVYASLAPSFVVAWPVEPGRLVGALRVLGFAGAGETAVGAELVAAAARRELERVLATGQPGCGATGSDGDVPRLPVVTTACPVVVNLMEMFYPEALPHASRVVSPMTAHARLLKAIHPGAKVVFVGPCVAKKQEAERPEAAGVVDAVLTLAELDDWFIEEGLDVARVEPVALDGPAPSLGRVFPTEGGFFRAASLPADLLSSRWVAVSGIDACREILGGLAAGGVPAGLESALVLELLACRGGCLAGPAMPAGLRSLTVVRRQRLLAYAGPGDRAAGPAERPAEPFALDLMEHGLERAFNERRPPAPVPTEEDIKAILARVGKHGPEDELNCGVCGYASCRDKAVAVYQGMAEPDMCLPYMRERAESLSNLVVAAAPSGVVAVDRELRIVFANAAFRRMFRLGADEPVEGRPLVEVLGDDTTFRAFQARTDDGGGGIATPEAAARESEVYYSGPDVYVRQMVFQLGDRDTIIGLFSDLSADVRQRRRLAELRGETVERAREVIAKQMKVAQEIAGLLGETTAETKVILTKLIEFINREDGGPNGA